MSLVAGPDPWPPALGLAYRGRVRDGAYTLVGATALGAAASLAYKAAFDTIVWVEVVLFWLGAWALLLVPVAALRWGRRVRVDAQGVTVMRPRGVVRAEIRWEEVEAFAQAGYGGLELRGAGKVVRLGDDVERVDLVWPRVRALCEERILEALRRAEETVLAVPASRLRAHGTYFLVTVLLTGMTGFYLWLWKESRSSFAYGAVIHLVLWGWLLLAWRRDVAWLGGSIRVGKDGLTIRKLDGARTVAWKDVVALRPTKAGWRLSRRSGRALHVHAGLLNLWPLERLIRERVEGA